LVFVADGVHWADEKNARSTMMWYRVLLLLGSWNGRWKFDEEDETDRIDPKYIRIDPNPDKIDPKPR
jgi:hypothetical protein